MGAKGSSSKEGETGFAHGHGGAVPIDPCGRSDSLCSGDSDRVEGIWKALGLKELGEPEREGGSESADSGGSTDHDLYGEVLEGYVVEMGTSNA